MRPMGDPGDTAIPASVRQGTSVGSLMDNVSERYRVAVSGRLAEPVLAVASFVRAGLPQSFLIAVTPSKVHAFAYARREVGVRVEDELAAWDRDSLVVHSEAGELGPRLTLQPEGEERVVCEGRDGPLVESVVSLLT